MKNVSVRVPVRVDLAGGTLDLWPLYLFHPGARTINVAVSLYAATRRSKFTSVTRSTNGPTSRSAR
jgi:galactokinase/mevalonate kinase-like predicted kinase